MTKADKSLEKIKSNSKNYTYQDAKQLLGMLGFTEYNRGRTSGSRVKFYRERNQKIFMLHKPHPGNEMSPGAVRDLIKFLIEIGELQ
jgi:hypothetical protein